MNALGMFLLGAAVRGAGLVAIAGVVGWAFRRRGPAASAWLGLATLVGMVGVAALGASPWPRWEIFASGEAAGPTMIRPVAAPGQPPPVADAEAPPPGQEIAATPDVKPPDEGLAGAVRALGVALMRPAAAPERAGWGWPGWVAAAAIAGIAIGLGRFALGLAAVAALRRGSHPIDDPDLLELASVLRQRLGVGPRVEVRVAPGLVMPATIGWRRPLILLPEDWPSWDERERRVVLAHELAHIRRDDYLAGVWAQLSLALQFYHPLAHRLALRLRLDQELAADAWGAALSGGNRTYLATLARLALRNEPRPVGWAARSFSPARGTFLRRIEMLRDSHDVSPAPLSRRSRAIALGGLLLAGLALAGLRVPGSMEVNAAAPAQAEGAGEGLSLDHGFIPADSGMVAAIRPAELLARPEFKQLLASLDPGDGLRKGLGIAPEEISQVTLVWLQGQASGPPRARPMLEPGGVILRTTRPVDGMPLGNVPPDAVREDVRFGDFTYTRLGQGEVRECFARPDDRTLIYAEEPNMLRLLSAKPGDAERASWSAGWKEIKKGQVAAAVDTTWLRITLQPLVANAGRGAGSPFDGFEPLLSKARTYAVGLDLVQKLRLDGISSCETEADAARVAETLKALLVLGKNSLESFRGQAKAQGREVDVAQNFLVNISTMLDRAEIKVDGKSVRVSAVSDLDPPKTVAALAPLVQGRRAAAKRLQSVNNLKQLCLAMHNYAQSHQGRFPAAVMYGPDGKTPHSWRVAVLPYLEQQALYDQYKFDEPWDGPNNRKLLDKMPLLFAHPDSPRNSPAYYMPTGPHTISPDNQGSSFPQITDGTSNTIALVEARRDIPWTKPEDIPIVGVGEGLNNAPLPPLGGFSAGGFNAAIADGSVRFISEKIDPTVLKALFSRDGGEVISSEAMNR
jgi:hypothetical protein